MTVLYNIVFFYYNFPRGMDANKALIPLGKLKFLV